MRIARVVAEIVVWWAVTFSVWVITLSAAPLQEYLLAAGCGLVAAITVFWARRALEASWTVRLRWLTPIVTVPVIAVTDTVQVLAAVVKRGQPGGRFVRVRTGAVGDGTEARSRRAVATWLMSITPGSFVLDADPDTGDLLVHSLAQRGPRMEKQVEAP